MFLRDLRRQKNQHQLPKRTRVPTIDPLGFVPVLFVLFTLAPHFDREIDTYSHDQAKHYKWDSVVHGVKGLTLILRASALDITQKVEG